MGVVEPLTDAVDTVREYPKLIGLVLAVSIVTSILGFIPLIGPFANMLIAPFCLAGLYGAFNLAFDGKSPDVGDFISYGEENFAPLLGAYLLLGFIMVLVMMAFSFAIGVAALGASSGEAGASGMGAAMSLMVLVGMLGMFVAMLFLQFIDVAIVIGDFSAVDSFKESWRVFRENPISVLGYTTIRTLLMGGGILVFFLTFAFGTGAWSATGSEPMLGGTLLFVIPVAFVVQIVLTAISQAYHVAYYRQVAQ